MANVHRPGVCSQCGRSLPEQQGPGRQRRYCGATCRSAARRHRGAGSLGESSVNETLTTAPREDIVDNVRSRRGEAPRGGLDPAGGARAGRDFVQQVLSGSGASPLAAIALAQAIARGADEEVAMTVRRAREAGHTWAEIGQGLGTSRQAAFQRFGRPPDPRTGKPMEPVLPDAGDRALRLLGDLTSGHWAAVCATFDASVAAKLDAAGLAAAWAQLIGLAGRYERHGPASVFQAGDYTVVDVPLYFEAGERVGRISYSRDARVSGIFFLPLGMA